MPEKMKLSELLGQIQDTIQSRFEGETFWITSQITDVRKQESARRCYLKFIEKSNNTVAVEMRGVFWSNAYQQIEAFEKYTKQSFTDGIEIICQVRVKFHPKFGLSLEVIQIDYAYTLGILEIERQQTLDRLLRENPTTIRLIDGMYRTLNNSLPLPTVIQRIALITAPNSDGQRDFKVEVEKNNHEYAFAIKEFLTQIQGDNAHLLILQQLRFIQEEIENFDVVAIVRGGGSQTDFKPFDEYELARYVAAFQIPIITGIGHDRNTSLVDMMARQHKTPTKVASYIVDHNFEFENSVLSLKDRFFESVADIIQSAKNDLKEMKRLVRLSSPSTILNKGFAIILHDDKIITDPKQIHTGMNLQTILKNETIHSSVTDKTSNEKRFDL